MLKTFFLLLEWAIPQDFGNLYYKMLVYTVALFLFSGELKCMNLPSLPECYENVSYYCKEGIGLCGTKIKNFKC